MGPSAHADEMSVRTNCRRSRESPFFGRRAANKESIPAYSHPHAMLNASLMLSPLMSKAPVSCLTVFPDPRIQCAW